ncbi:MAG: NAD(P)-binding protein, partial [Desulfurivibrionaceae bacterium]
MDKKYGAYICTGCGIGDALDIAALTKAAGENGMEAKTHEALCSKAGRELIENDITNDGVNTIVVCACSPRVMKDEFNFGDDKYVTRANLREGVAWCAEEVTEKHTAEKVKEFATEKGQDYVRMACVQAKKGDVPDPYKLESINRKILVMGGGIAGMTAAMEAAKAGYAVTIIEAQDKLGGKALGWRKQFPTAAPWTDLEEPTVQAMVDAVQAEAGITVKASTEVARIAGAPGAYKVTLKAAGTKSEWDAPKKVGVDEQDKISKGEMEDPNAGLQPYMVADAAAEDFGAVVLATGWNPADVSEYAHLGYGKLKGVVTNAEFEKLAKTGKVPANVAFVQSPGGAEHDQDFPYCNSVTSMVALKQARYVREDNAAGKAYVLYQHMRTPGNMEMFYKGAQNDDGIFMTKATVTQVEE